jgi:hypothetical protein
VFVSNTVHDQVRDRLPFVFEDLSSSRSSICSAGCGTTGALSLRAPPRTRQRRLCRCCRSRNSRRSRCCRLPIINGDPEQAYFRRRHGRVDHHRALPYPLAVRDSPQFGFTYKGRAVDVKQIGRELGVRYVLEGLGAEGRAAGAHHRPADRRGNGNASLGRPLRWLARRRVRAPGKVAVSIAGLIEPAFASDRDARLHQAAYDRPQRLRSLPASAGDLLSDNKRADFLGLRIA